MPDECVFCKIVAGQIPASVVLDTASVMAFLDIRPIAIGHTLVMLKRHVPSILEMSQDELADLFGTASRVADAVQNAVEADTFNIEINDGPAAGQEIPHVHVHIVPRRHGDGISGGWKHTSYQGAELAAVTNSIRAGLSREG